MPLRNIRLAPRATTSQTWVPGSTEEIAMYRALVSTVGALLFAWVSTGNAAPCAGFADVDSTDPFCGYVTWMKNRGITLGCPSPPGTSRYCPGDPVTRLQMAAFMYRLGYQNAFLQGGNAFGATAVLGTADNQPLDVLVGGTRVMRYEPSYDNVIGGSGSVADPFVTNGTVAGGSGNRVTADRGTVSGGINNTAGFHATVAGGLTNTASGPYSIVLGGANNVASAGNSVAAGSFANANGDDCAVFSLWGGGPPGMSCFGINRIFLIGAQNGFAVDYGTKRPDGGGFKYIGIGRVPGQTIATWTGAYLSDTGVWQGNSDANAKHAFERLDTRAILERLVTLPIQSWRYLIESENVRHVGPTAQDFRATFGLGQDERTIGMVDADGIALAAIQGLNAKVEERVAAKDDEIAALRAELRSLKEEVARLRATQSR